MLERRRFSELLIPQLHRYDPVDNFYQLFRQSFRVKLASFIIRNQFHKLCSRIFYYRLFSLHKNNIYQLLLKQNRLMLI